MDLHSYWDKKKKIPGTKSTVSICPLVRNKIEMLTKMYFTVCQVSKIVHTEKNNVCIKLLYDICLRDGVSIYRTEHLPCPAMLNMNKLDLH